MGGQRDGGALHAVILETLAIARVGITTVLEADGVSVVAHSAKPSDILHAVRTARPDLLVVGDHPEVVGSVIRRSKAITTKPLATVALVREPSPEVMAAFLAAGADGLVPRTVPPAELVETVRRVLAGERVVSQSLLPVLIGMTVEKTVDGVAGEPHPATLLTGRQREVVQWLAEGMDNESIASAMFLSESTVRGHLSQIYAKLGVKNRRQALARAVETGLLH